MRGRASAASTCTATRRHPPSRRALIGTYPIAVLVAELLGDAVVDRLQLDGGLSGKRRAHRCPARAASWRTPPHHRTRGCRQSTLPVASSAGDFSDDGIDRHAAAARELGDILVAAQARRVVAVGQTARLPGAEQPLVQAPFPAEAPRARPDARVPCYTRGFDPGTLTGSSTAAPITANTTSHGTTPRSHAPPQHGRGGRADVRRPADDRARAHSHLLGHDVLPLRLPGDFDRALRAERQRRVRVRGAALAAGAGAVGPAGRARPGVRGRDHPRARAAGAHPGRAQLLARESRA